MQIVAVAIALLSIHFVGLIWVPTPSRAVPPCLVTLASLLIAWHGFRISPYTPLSPFQAANAVRNHQGQSTNATPKFRVMVSNVELENNRFARWRDVVKETNPDVLIVLETDHHWVREIAPLRQEYPHCIAQPQDNWYGMVLLSRFPIESYQIRFVVEQDIPSIDAKVRLPDARLVRVVGVHPRPPEPLRDNNSVARDAELILWARELQSETGPVIIGGDLNDVAWSKTTRLFLRTSGMLDPRRGRGFFNTFHARHRWMRFPLDHVFHSTHFSVREIRRLPFVGSDHFPILIDLRLQPETAESHQAMERKSGDRDAAEEHVRRAEQASEMNAVEISEIDED